MQNLKGAHSYSAGIHHQTSHGAGVGPHLLHAAGHRAHRGGRLRHSKGVRGLKKYRDVVQRVAGQPAAGGRNHHRIRQLVSCACERGRHPRIRTPHYGVDRRYADQQYRNYFQQHLAHQVVTVARQNALRLHRIHLPYTYIYCRHIGCLYLSGYNFEGTRRVCRTGGQHRHHAHALCHHVGRVHLPLCLHAQHHGATQKCGGAGNPRRCVHAGAAVRLHPFANMGVKLQCHLWVVRSPAALHALAANLMDHHPRGGAPLLYQPKS